MKVSVIACVVSLFLVTNKQAFAQNITGGKLTLRQSVETAINNNLLVKQTDLQTRAASINLSQAKSNQLPDLFTTLGHGINQGRSIDPFSNSYINQQVNYANYSLNSGVVLFNGFQLKNLVKQNALSYEANKMDLQQTKDNLTLNVILAYLQILTNEELLQQSINQAAVTKQQVERLNILNAAGAITPAQLYDLKGQLGNDELAIVNNRNAVNTARLTLSQLMNVAYINSLPLEKVTADTVTLNYAGNPKDLYDISVNQLAIVKAADLRQKSAQKSVQVAKGYFYPTIGLNGSFNTSYSSAASRDIAGNTSEVASGDYVNVNGSKVSVMTTRTNFTTQKINYSDQFNNNYNTSIFLSINVPIFNRNLAKNRVALAKIELQNAEVTAQTVKTQLSQNIEQAYFNMQAALEKYKTLQQQVADFAESFRTAEVRFNAGAINQVDYIIAKNNVERAQINLITTKYDYIFRTKILDYYQNKLTLD
jgi:outer membrane protein